LVVVVVGGQLWTAAQGRRREDTARRQRAEAARVEALGTDAFLADRYDSARTLYLRVIALDPTRTVALNNLGMIRLHDRDYTAADSLFGAALRWSGDDPKFRAATLHNLAECDIARRVYDRAVRRLDEAFSIDSSTADAYNNLGWAMIQNGQSGDALDVLERGMRRFPSEKYLYKNAGLAARDMGNLKQALRFLDEALRRDPGFKEAADLRDAVKRGMAHPS
jgi:tetratricopeptide (TPR) repeat protein